MDKCLPSPRMLALLENRIDDAEECAQLHRHLRRCPSCRENLMAVAEVLAKVDRVRVKRADRVDAAALARKFTGKSFADSVEMDVWRRILELRRKWASGKVSEEDDFDAVAASCDKLYFCSKLPENDPHFWLVDLDVAPDGGAEKAFFVRVHVKPGMEAASLKLCGANVELGKNGKKGEGDVSRDVFVASRAKGGISVKFSDGRVVGGEPKWGMLLLGRR